MANKKDEVRTGLTLEQVVDQAEKILGRWVEGADIAAGFDAGEFSGPECDKAASREIAKLAAENGYAEDEVWLRMADLNG